MAKRKQDDPFGIKLESLKFKPPEWCRKPSEKLVSQFETQFAVTLPADYRAFLLKYGGYFGSGRVPYLEPAPLGDIAIFDGFYGFMSKEYDVYGINWATDVYEVAPDYVPVGIGSMNGCTILLRCTGRNAGSVYFYDAQQRSLWPDEQFHQMFCNLSPLIVRYLDLRRNKLLPKKARGYESLYLLGKSFTEFIEALQPDPDSDE